MFYSSYTTVTYQRLHLFLVIKEQYHTFYSYIWCYGTSMKQVRACCHVHYSGYHIQLFPLSWSYEDKTNAVCCHVTEKLPNRYQYKSCFAFVPQVTVNPSRSGRMDLFSLMQSIQLDDEERLSDLEVLFYQSPCLSIRRPFWKLFSVTWDQACNDVKRSVNKKLILKAVSNKDLKWHKNICEAWNNICSSYCAYFLLLFYTAVISVLF